MKKRVIDIFPPRAVAELPPSVRQDEAVRVISGRGARPLPKWPALAVFLLLSPIAILHFVLAETTVSIWPQTRQLRAQETIYANVHRSNLDLPSRVIPGLVARQEREDTQLFSSSGKKFKDAKASGFIRVYNTNSASPQILVANTRFISEEGKLFRSTERVTIPGGHNDEKGKYVSGSLNVRVLAAEPGEDHNIGPSNFSLPGLAGSPLYTKIYGKSFQAMEGGAQKEVSVVTQNDLNNARETLVQTLTAQVTESLRAKIPEDAFLVENSMVSEALKEESLVKAGAELDQFNYTAKVSIRALVIQKSDANALARYIMEEQLAEAEQLNETTIQVGLRAKNPNEGSDDLAIEANISSTAQHEFDIRNLREELRGAPKTEVAGILSSYPYLARAELSLWPFWLRNVSQSADNITIDVAR